MVYEGNREGLSSFLLGSKEAVGSPYSDVCTESYPTTSERFERTSDLYSPIKQAFKMSVQEIIQEEEFVDTKYPHLRLLTGGKGPPEGPVDNWLAEYEVGTTFVARHKNSNEVDYNLYYVLYKDLPEVVLLKWQLPDGKVLDYYVDPVRFSKVFPEKKILSIQKPEEPQKEAKVSEDGSTG